MDSGSYSQHRNIQVASVNKQACFGRKRVPLHRDPSDHVFNYRFNATIRCIRLDAGAISLPQIVQSESSRDQLSFLRAFFKLHIFEKCKQILIKSGKNSTGKKGSIAGQGGKRSLEASSEYRIQQYQSPVQDSRTLIQMSLGGHLTADAVRQTVMSLSSSELAKLSHALITSTRDLLCSSHGHLLLCCLADHSTSIFHRLSEVCLASFSELILFEGALHVISHMTRSARSEASGASIC